MSRKKRILVAEDEGIVARDIQNQLRALGYDTDKWVTSGEDAVRAAEESSPDLVLMDIRLQGVLDGIEAAAEIRSRLGIPVVYLTAHADAPTVERAKETRPLGYILKPFRESDLHVTIELALVKHAADLALREREQWLSITLRSIGDAVIATDRLGLVRFLNPVAERLTGWSSEEASGRPLREVFVTVAEDTREPGPDVFERVIEKGTVIGLANHTLLRSRTGAEFPIGDSAAPIRDELGSVIGVVLVFRDLSAERSAQHTLAKLLADLQRANHALSEETALLSAVFEAIPSAVLVVSSDHRVLVVNRHVGRTFGHHADTLADLKPGKALQCQVALAGRGGCGALEGCETCQVRSNINEALEGKQVHRRRAMFRIAEGSASRSLVLLVTATPLDHRGERMVLLILEDATELSNLRALVGAENSFAGIVGRDPRMHEVFATIREVAEVSIPVLIEGESGTGKELIARAIHNLGPRSNHTFVAVNCAALPEGLLESELFGHVKGAFTGAIRDKKGRFELADGGTIFLDEVAELPQSMQVKLLRTLQEQAFERVGGERTVKVDVRIISATNRDLRKEIAAGRFREDLFYRLCVVPITVPPLRDRAADIPLLAGHILEKVAMLSNRGKAGISPEALEILMNHSWPGNVRELGNVLEYALIKSRGEEVLPHHLPPTLRSVSVLAASGRGAARKLTTEAITRALQATNGNRVKAAQLLRVSRATLYRYLDGLSAQP
ncbi:MAG: sigma 54-interacting transcriptional regulator [Thermoanaerobaculaceae bacterium]